MLNSHKMKEVKQNKISLENYKNIIQHTLILKLWY